jgi:hypothetical protein
LLAKYLNLENLNTKTASGAIVPITYKAILSICFPPPTSETQNSTETETHRLRDLYTLAQACLEKLNLEEGLTWEEVYAALGEEEEVIQREVVRGIEVEPIGGKLMIWKRARHVVSPRCIAFTFRSRAMIHLRW